MNADRITDWSPLGYEETELMLAAARQLDAMFRSILPWSFEVGLHLMFSLSYERFEFPDGTVLGDDSNFESIIGRRGAAAIMAALDPLDRGMQFWHLYHHPSEETAESLEAEKQLRAALAAAGIRVGV